jgi:eukaryotic-like serine/threonine-protein kinase
MSLSFGSLPPAATLDALPPSSPGESLVATKARHQVALIEGSAPGLSGETRDLTRVRLRAAALCLAIGCGAMMIFLAIKGAPTPGLDQRKILTARAVLLAVLSGCAVGLYRRRSIRLPVLRIYEALIFGAPLAYTAMVQHDIMEYAAEMQKDLPHPPSTYVYLIYIYALFIPNTLRRAAIVLGVLAGTPLLVTTVMAVEPGACGILLGASPAYIGEMAVMLAIGFGTSLYGVHMIGALRREAFEARQFGQYKLCRLIGAGGMGEVYLAEHQLMKRRCAIKVIRPSKANDPQALARFEREVRATAKLTHWNTVEIFDYGRTEDGTFYYVMEYLPGMSVAELVDRHGPLEPARVMHLLRQTCDALAEAHALKLIHRDIKPGNIFVAQRGGVYDVAKLLDFGLAKPLLSEKNSVQLTQEGSLTGSPLYMSPEQAMGESPPDERSDIYSLGCVAYFMLTGSPPFKGDNPLKVIFAHAHEPLTPPSQLRPEIPADLENVVLRCLAKGPDDRFQTVNELGAALAQCAAAADWSRQHAAEWWLANVGEKQAAAPCQPALV